MASVFTEALINRLCRARAAYVVTADSCRALVGRLPRKYLSDLCIVYVEIPAWLCLVRPVCPASIDFNYNPVSLMQFTLTPLHHALYVYTYILYIVLSFRPFSSLFEVGLAWLAVRNLIVR